MNMKKSGSPFWGVTRTGVRLSIVALMLSGLVSVWLFGNSEYISWYWQYPLLIDTGIILAPFLIAAIVLMISGFFIHEIEWRVSQTGIGWFMGVLIFGMLVSITLYAFMVGQEGKNPIFWLMFAVGTPLPPAIGSFIYWGFRAAEADKRNRYRFRGP